VIASGRRLEPVEAVAGKVRALGRRALALSCDVRDAAHVGVSPARSRAGGTRTRPQVAGTRPRQDHATAV